MKYNPIEKLRAWLYEFIKPQKSIKPVHEQTHTYFYVGGYIVTIKSIIQVTIFPTGCKGLLDKEGRFYIVPPFWTHAAVDYTDPKLKGEKLANTYYGKPISVTQETCQ